MSEFFLELFSDEIPASLQKNAREALLQNFKFFFEKENIGFTKCNTYSTPNRLLILFDNIKKEIIQKSEEIKGPNINTPEKALEGFLRSNKIAKEEIFKKKTDKGEFYFYKKLEKKVYTIDLLEKNIPQILDKISWKKSMKWGNFDLNWARPLKSILAIFDKKTIEFDYHHLKSSNSTFLDKEFEAKEKIFNSYKAYKDYFKKTGIIVDQDLRKLFIEKELEKNAKRKNLIVEIDKKLLDEVINLVEKPNILICSFDSKFLDIPKEILIITMKHHQKYFPTFNSKGNITNQFLVVANNKDRKGFLRSGNERVVED